MKHLLSDPGVTIHFKGIGAEIDEKCFSDRASVPQEGADNTLDTIDAVCVEWRPEIERRCLLVIFIVGDWRMLVRR